MSSSVAVVGAKVYERQDCSVSMEKANGYALLMLAPIIGGVGALYVAVWGLQKPVNEFLALLGRPARLLLDNLLLIGVFVVGTVLHELIHALTWQVAGRKSWSAIKFGFQWRTLMPYTHLREPLPVWAYRLGTWMPGFVTGVVPAVYGLISGNVWVTLVGGAFIGAAAGDILVLLLLRSVEKTALVEDHPTQVGCYILHELANAPAHLE
jgi:hypothetical protein